jgi:hypothetical protein
MSRHITALTILMCLIFDGRPIYGLLAVPHKALKGYKFDPKLLSPTSLAASKATESVRQLRDKLQTPPESIIRAVEKIGPNVPISVADASALSGTDLNTARTNLMILASLTGGDLEVTEDGEIMYSFPKSVRSVLEKRSFGQKIKVTYNSLYPYLLFALRSSFGILLLTSLAIVVGTFITISSSSSSDDRDRDSNRGRGVGVGGGNWLPGGNIADGFADQFYFRQNYGFYQSRGYRPDYSTRNDKNDGNGVSFIESFFSYVFGDGDPNAGDGMGCGVTPFVIVIWWNVMA